MVKLSRTSFAFLGLSDFVVLLTAVDLPGFSELLMVGLDANFAAVGSLVTLEVAGDFFLMDADFVCNIFGVALGNVFVALG
jgi:hypothetical protein